MAEAIQALPLAPLLIQVLARPSQGRPRSVVSLIFGVKRLLQSRKVRWQNERF